MFAPLTIVSRLSLAQRRLFAMGLVLFLLPGVAAFCAPSSPNPVPLINQPLIPTAVVPVAPAGAGFTLTVNGTGFVNGAVVNWNGAGLATTFVSSSQLTATVPGDDITSPSTASITVTNPPPGSVTSNVVFLPVTGPTPSVTFFRLPLTFSTPGTLYQGCIVSGDFNQDGILDLAIPNEGIFLGNGDGTFTASTSNTSVTNLSNTPCFAVGDFNGDGIPDVATTTGVYLGNGDGTFQAPLVYPAGLVGDGVLIAGDFNGDGKLDLAMGITVPGFPTAYLAILLGNGDGTFQAPSAASGTIVNLLVPDHVQSIAVGDLTGEGKLDLVVGIYRGLGQGQISILLGNGDGTFQSSPATYSIGQIGSVIVADFNGDGILDLATSTEVGNNHGVYIWLGSGDGTFNIQSTAADPTPARSLFTADVNGDGKLDLVVGYGTAVSDTTATGVLLGNGDGTFAAPTQYSFWATPPNPPPAIGDISVVAGDFNGDGRMDFALLSSQKPTLEVFLQTSVVQIGLTSSSLVFATPQAIGTSSAAQTVQVTNSGSAPLTFSSILASTNFTESDNCQPGVEPASECTISVYFAPTAVGSLTGTLTLTDNAPTSPQTVQLSGTAFFPGATLSAASLSFGNQNVGTASSSQPLNVTNNAAVALNISNIAISSGWTQSNQCGSIAAGATCTINVSFAPTAMGSQNGTLTLTDSAANSPQSISLSGTGLEALAGLSQSTLTFAPQLLNTASTQQTVTLQNTGNEALSLSILLGGANSGDFSLSQNCGSSVAAGASCQISVTFTPTALGTRSASVSVTDNAANSPQSISLSGAGIGPVASLSPSSLTFAAQFVGTNSASQSVVLTNTGDESMSISSIQSSGDFSETNTCANTLAAGANCTISLVFDPSAVGARSGTLTITDNASGSPQSVQLSGTGLDFQLSSSGGPGAVSATITPGQTVTYTLVLVPEGGLSQTVNLTCSGAPADSTCTINPSSFTLNGTTTVTVTVTTTAGSLTLPFGKLLPPSITGSGRMLWLYTFLVLASLAALALSRKRRPAYVLGTCLLVVMLWTACGGGGGGSSPVAHTAATPSGTYTLNVSAAMTPAGSTTPVTHTINLTLTVN